LTGFLFGLKLPLKFIEGHTVQHKTLFFSQKWASYDTAKPGTFYLLPPEPRINNLKKDYDAMSAMIFGEAPGWEDIIQELKLLEKRINKR
jgi:hypothetical protein